MGFENTRSAAAKRTKKKYPFNEFYFENIDTPHKAYWLGFISADGFLDELRNYLEIGLAKKDEQTLLNFSKDIESNKPLYYQDKLNSVTGKRHPSCSLRIYSKKMISDLKKLGIHQKKSLNFVPPNERQVPNKLLKYWILGYFDGDGCICYQSNGRFESSFIGTRKTVSFIKERLKLTNNIQQEHPKKCRNTWAIHLQENATIKVFSYLYDDQILDVCMKRKYNKFLKCLEKKYGN